MSQFITRAFSDGNDEALQLGKEEWVRTLAIGNAWNQLRIGILCVANPLSPGNTGGLPAGTGFAFGMCSGKANTFGSAATTNFVGVDLQHPTGWSYSSGTGGAAMWANNGGGFAATKINSSITHVTLGGGFNWLLPVIGNESPNRRYFFVLDILKGSPDYTIRLMAVASGGGIGTGTATNVDYTVPDLKSILVQTTGSPTVEGFGVEDHSAAIAASEVAGALDTVNVYCNMAAYPFELYEVAVEKLA